MQLDFKSVVFSTSVNTHGIRGIVNLTDMVWETGSDLDDDIDHKDFASYYKTDTVTIEWTARFDHKGAGFYWNIVINKISGTHHYEYLDWVVDDCVSEFEIEPDDWELKASAYYSSDEFAYQKIPDSIYPKGIEIDYNEKNCVVYFGK